MIQQCCEMLDYLGVPYVQSAGEAEAMCAFLNKNHVSNELHDSFDFIVLEYNCLPSVLPVCFLFFIYLLCGGL